LEEPDDLLSKQITEPINKTPSPVIEQVEEAKASLSSSGSRSRGSLKFASLATKEDRSTIQPIVDDLLLINEAVNSFSLSISFCQYLVNHYT
jgi:hypothetical protein